MSQLSKWLIDWFIYRDLEKIQGYGTSKAIHHLNKKMKKDGRQKKVENPNLHLILHPVDD